MQMVIKHISEKFVFHVLHKLSHSWIKIKISEHLESNSILVAHCPPHTM